MDGCCKGLDVAVLGDDDATALLFECLHSPLVALGVRLLVRQIDVQSHLHRAEATALLVQDSVKHLIHECQETHTFCIGGWRKLHSRMLELIHATPFQWYVKHQLLHVFVANQIPARCFYKLSDLGMWREVASE